MSVFPDISVLFGMVAVHSVSWGVDEDPDPIQVVSRHAGRRLRGGRLHVPGDAVELQPRLSRLCEQDGPAAPRVPRRGARRGVCRGRVLEIPARRPATLASDAPHIPAGPVQGTASAGTSRRGSTRGDGISAEAARAPRRHSLGVSGRAEAAGTRSLFCAQGRASGREQKEHIRPPRSPGQHAFETSDA